MATTDALSTLATIRVFDLAYVDTRLGSEACEAVLEEYERQTCP